MRENSTYGSMRGRAFPITRGVPLYSTPLRPPSGGLSCPEQAVPQGLVAQNRLQMSTAARRSQDARVICNPCFCAHPLAAIKKQCYNIGNTRAGPLARLVRGMSIKGAFLSMDPPWHIISPRRTARLAIR